MTTKKMIKYALLSSSLILLLLFPFAGWFDLLGFLLGALWSIVNLYVINLSLKQLLVRRNYMIGLVLLLVKFPVLYWLGYELLRFPSWNPWFVAAAVPAVMFGMVCAYYLQAKREHLPGGTA